MKKKLKITLNAPFTLGFALLCGLALDAAIKFVDRQIVKAWGGDEQ